MFKGKKRVFLLCINKQNISKSQTLPSARHNKAQAEIHRHWEGQKSGCLRTMPPSDESLSACWDMKARRTELLLLPLSAFVPFPQSHVENTLNNFNLLCLYPLLPWSPLQSQCFIPLPVWPFWFLIYSVPLFAFTVSKALKVFWCGCPTSNTGGYDIVTRITGLPLFPHFALNIEGITLHSFNVMFQTNQWVLP